MNIRRKGTGIAFTATLLWALLATIAAPLAFAASPPGVPAHAAPAGTFTILRDAVLVVAGLAWFALVAVSAFWLIRSAIYALTVILGSTTNRRRRQLRDSGSFGAFVALFGTSITRQFATFTSWIFGFTRYLARGQLVLTISVMDIFGKSGANVNTISDYTGGDVDDTGATSSNSAISARTPDATSSPRPALRT